jgi:hypothetical protein
MKKIICIVLALALIFGLCSCSASPEDKECIGYIIIPHADGHEHADIYRYITCYGNIIAYCLDGRVITSPQIIVVEYEE